MLIIVVAAGGLPVACSHWSGGPERAGVSGAAGRALWGVQARYAPDRHLGIYSVGLQRQGQELLVTGEVDRVEAKVATLQALEGAGVKVRDCVRVLPAEELGERVWGIASLSVASAREKPEHMAEMGTQILMGGVVKVWKSVGNGWWYYVQCADGYPAWLEKGTFVRCTREQVEAWNCAPRLIVTAMEATVLEGPQAEAMPVSDVVIADLLKRVGEAGEVAPGGAAGRTAGLFAEESGCGLRRVAASAATDRGEH
ncbi:MAG TPA: hypothetical protein VNZ22_20555 [Bacillota bacterium]|nr:hypothetical protein [Bacillota bacterium]